MDKVEQGCSHRFCRNWNPLATGGGGSRKVFFAGGGGSPGNTGHALGLRRNSRESGTGTTVVTEINLDLHYLENGDRPNN